MQSGWGDERGMYNNVNHITIHESRIPNPESLKPKSLTLPKSQENEL